MQDNLKPETLITYFAKEFGADEFINKEAIEKAGKYIESELGEWKSIVKKHPIQTAFAASGLLVGLTLRFGKQLPFKRVKEAVPESVSGKVLELAPIENTSAKKKKTTKKTKKKSA